MPDTGIASGGTRHALAGAGGPRFVTTHWTAVTAAGQRDTTQAREALGGLCQNYWLPLYAYARRRGYLPPDAEDLTQEFFAQLIEKRTVQAADRAKGRFRSFLLTAFKHFLAHEWEKARAEKRGGRVRFIPLPGGTAETHYAPEPASHDTPDRAFDRQWALSLLEVVLGRLRQEYAERGREPLFLGLRETLKAGAEVRYAELATSLGMSDGAVKVAAHRMRRRYRELLREEIGRTVGSPALVEEELRDLFAALGN